jgi:hypothetical protein
MPQLEELYKERQKLITRFDELVILQLLCMWDNVSGVLGVGTEDPKIVVLEGEGLVEDVLWTIRNHMERVVDEIDKNIRSLGGAVPYEENLV